MDYDGYSQGPDWKRWKECAHDENGKRFLLYSTEQLLTFQVEKRTKDKRQCSCHGGFSLL